MQSHLFEEFTSSIDELMVGYGREKEYNANNEPPPFAAYESIRRQTSGGLCYASTCACTATTACSPLRFSNTRTSYDCTILS